MNVAKAKGNAFFEVSGKIGKLNEFIAEARRDYTQVSEIKRHGINIQLFEQYVAKDLLQNIMERALSELCHVFVEEDRAASVHESIKHAIASDAILHIHEHGAQKFVHERALPYVSSWDRLRLEDKNAVHIGNANGTFVSLQRFSTNDGSCQFLSAVIEHIGGDVGHWITSWAARLLAADIGAEALPLAAAFAQPVLKELKRVCTEVFLNTAGVYLKDNGAVDRYVAQGNRRDH